MIVYNEELFLRDCLASIRHIADEIVIVDTGSTDSTKTIAEKFGARIFDFPWRGDFAAARNESLKHARGEWVLYIDADERLQPVERSYLESFLAKPDHHAAFTVLFHPHSNYTAYREYRLFRNDPRIRFKGVIHETIVPAIYHVAGEDKLDIGQCDLTIRHLGYDGDQAYKHRRNIPLLKNHLAKDPERIYCWWNLGYALNGVGDTEGADRAWETGINHIRKKKRLEPADSQPYAELIRHRYMKGQNISELLDEAMALFPDQYLLIWLKAMILKDTNQTQEAVRLFKQLVSVDTNDLNGGILAYDVRIFGSLSLEPLAECYYKMGRFKESASFYARVEESEPENIEYKIKRQFVSVRAGYFEDGSP